MSTCETLVQPMGSHTVLTVKVVNHASLELVPSECVAPTPCEVGSLIGPSFQSIPHELPPPLPGTLTKTGKRIAGGGYGDVFRGTWSAPGAEPTPVIIKCVRPLDEAQDDRFKTIADGVPMLVSPWCKNGNLATFVDSHPELGRNDKLKLLCDAAHGLIHLHSHEPPIFHGDIKPQNVIVQDNLEGALCDFGISKVILGPGRHSGLTTSNNSGGTLGYQAKELLENDASTSAVDVYAFGGLILATMSGKPPFWKKRDTAKILAICEDRLPEPVDHPQLPRTDSLWDLMHACWNSEPVTRPSMSTVLQRVSSLDTGEYISILMSSLPVSSN
ncbi:hypothetical protein FS837_010954 [Tulasnella sp. UAMH 9824]|nr:hypothetical protein FS837_010954 [Tulasnella sp. UAMH 9824]